MNPWKHINTKIYAQKYIDFKKENKIIIDMINLGARNIEYNEHDFQSVIEVWDKLNELHEDLLEAAARNVRMINKQKQEHIKKS